MSSARVIAGALAVACLAGCAARQPVRLRWADTSTPLEQTVVPTLAISSTEAEPQAGARVKDFSERGGAAYIQALAAKLKDPAEFRAAVAAGIAPPKIGDADHTKLARVLSIGIGKSGYQAGQRLVAARVTIVPVGFAFADFTLATSKYETIDLENVSVQSTTTAKIGIAPSLGSVIEAADASLSQEEKAGTTYTNRARIEALTPDFRPDRIEIYQQSAPNEDLTGTVLISAAVRPIGLGAEAKVQRLAALGLAGRGDLDFPSDQTSDETVVAKLHITDDKGGLLAPAKSAITTVVDRIWLARPLMACAALDYVERVPRAGTQRYFDEGRQVVVEREGSLAGKLYQLVPAEEVARPLWGLADPSPLTTTSTRAASRPGSIGNMRASWAPGNSG